MTTFSERKTALDAISKRIGSNRQTLDNAEANVDAVVSNVASMRTQYTTLINELGTEAGASPNDVAVQNQNAEAQKLVAEFNAQETRAQNMKAKLDELNA